MQPDLFTTKCVNRSPKSLDLQKFPNPIRTSVGHPIFSWTIFDNFCLSLYISNSQRTSGMQETIYKYNEWWQIFEQFLGAKTLDIFGQNFWLALDFRLDRIWETSASYPLFTSVKVKKFTSLLSRKIVLSIRYLWGFRFPTIPSSENGSTNDTRTWPCKVCWHH